ADLARGAQIGKRGQRLVDDLLQVRELDVVALDYVDVVCAKSVQALVHARHDEGGREVEARLSVTADLRGEYVAIAINTTKRPAEHGFGAGETVERRHVDDIH